MKTELKKTCHEVVDLKMNKYSIAVDETPRSIHLTILSELLRDVDGLMLLFDSLGQKECLARYRKRLSISKKDIEKACYSSVSIFSTSEDRRRANNRLFYFHCWFEYYQVVLMYLTCRKTAITERQQ